jgi:RNA polymerase sigma factor for flagellar operon FliA
MTGADIAAVLPGVRRMAQRTPLAQNGAMDADDMEQDAVTGVLHAARTFDAQRGAGFATHAYLRARGALLDGQRAMDHVPRSWRAAQREVLRARTALVAELAKEPAPEELAGRLDISTQQLRDIEDRCRPPASLTEALRRQRDQGEQLTVADLVPDDEPLPDELIVAREDAERLHAAIDLLPERQRFAIRATWFTGMTVEEAADILGVTPSRVSQLRSEALERLGVVVGDLARAA